MVTAVTSHVAEQDAETDATTIEAVLADVERVLTTDSRLDPATADAIRRAMRVDVPAAVARKRVGDYWRAFVRRNGLRCAERRSNISRFHILLTIADVQPNQGVWQTMQIQMPAAIEWETERDAARSEKARP